MSDTMNAEERADGLMAWKDASDHEFRGAIIGQIKDAEQAGRAEVIEVLEEVHERIYQLIPGEYTQEGAEEYYERVTEGELPNLHDWLLAKIRALKEQSDE